MRVVLDTNVWISGLLLPQSKAGAILKKWEEGNLTVIISKLLLQEIEEVLSYPKIFKRVGWDKEKIETYLDMLTFFTESVSFEGSIVKVEKDPKDASILATFIESHADFLVTGDKVLLEFQSRYSIISVADFYTRIS